jgi:hypothetical protein
VALIDATVAHQVRHHGASPAPPWRMDLNQYMNQYMKRACARSMSGGRRPSKPTRRAPST